MVIWDMEGVLMVDWLPWGTTWNLDILQHHHSLSLGNPVTVQREIGTANALLHDNASSHTSSHTTGTLASFGITVLPQPAYSPDLALSVMSCGSRWKSHCVVDSSQTVTSSGIVFAHHGMLSWKGGLLQPCGSCQKIAVVYWTCWGVCGVCCGVVVQLIFCEWPSHKKMYEN